MQVRSASVVRSLKYTFNPGFNQLNRDEGVKENGEHISRLLPGDQKLRVAVRCDQHLAELAYKLHHFHGHVAHDDFGKYIEDQPLKLLLHPLLTTR